MSGIILTTDAYFITAVSIVITFFSTIVRHKVVDMKAMKESQKLIKEHQKTMKEALKKQETKKAQKLQEEVMKLTMANMKNSFKPMIFTMIPFILIFGWLRGNFDERGAVYNLTVTDVLPPGIASVSIDNNGTYHDATRKVEWTVDRVRGGDRGWLSANLTVEEEFAPEPEENIELRYTERNGTLFSGPVFDSAVKITKDLNRTNNIIHYTLEYENQNQRKVVTLFGYKLGWLGWYIMCSMISGITLNKIFEKLFMGKKDGSTEIQIEK